MAVVAERLRFVTAPDGREVAFAVWGDPTGFPVMRLHGTPGCRLMRWPDEELYGSLGVCFVTHDRAARASPMVVGRIDERTTCGPTMVRQNALAG